MHLAGDWNDDLRAASLTSGANTNKVVVAAPRGTCQPFMAQELAKLIIVYAMTQWMK